MSIRPQDAAEHPDLDATGRALLARATASPMSLSREADAIAGGGEQQGAAGDRLTAAVLAMALRGPVPPAPSAPSAQIPPTPRGCHCPPGAEAACGGLLCPRRPIGTTAA